MPSDDVKEKYNTLVGQELRGQYEKRRWFSDAVQTAAFRMTQSAIQTHALGKPFAQYLEVGPGPGTWTKEFLAFAPQAFFHLVDISEAMIKVAKKELGEKGNVKCTMSDFLKFSTDGEKYDLFFSSRAIEYMDDKNAVVKKVVTLLDHGGRGIIITKTPKYFRSKLLRRKTSAFHRGQVSPRVLVKLLCDAGCTAVAAYPVTVSVPLFHSPSLNLRLYRFVGKRSLNFFSQFFSESYLVTFTKP